MTTNELEAKLRGMKRQEVIKFWRKYKKSKAKEDLYYFNKDVLGLWMYPHVHKPICDMLQDTTSTKRDLIMMPRGTYKSYCVTAGYIMWRLLKEPTLKILIDSETFTKAKIYLRAIKGMYLTDKRNVEGKRFGFGDACFVELFGDLRDKSKWTEDAVNVIGYDPTQKETSISVSGTDKPKTGSHFDIIICDDLHGPENTKNSDQMEKVKSHFGDLTPLLNPGGKLIVVGTSWSDEDLYSSIVNEVEGLSWKEMLARPNRFHAGRDYDIYVRSAIEEGKYFFPEILHEKALEEKRRGCGTEYKFQCQYMNDPIRRSGTEFKAEWFKSVKELPKHEGVTEFGYRMLLIDPAFTSNTTSDYTAFVVVMITPSGDWYVLESIHVKYDPGLTLNKIFELFTKWRFNVVGIESISAQRTLIHWLKERQSKTRYHFRIEELHGRASSKEERIRGLIPKFRDGQVYFVGEDHEDIIHELERFPNSKHDDLADALSYGLQLGRIPKRRTSMLVEGTYTNTGRFIPNG